MLITTKKRSQHKIQSATSLFDLGLSLSETESWTLKYLLDQSSTKLRGLNMYLDHTLRLSLSLSGLRQKCPLSERLSEITSLCGLTLYLDWTLAQREAKSKTEVAHCQLLQCKWMQYISKTRQNKRIPNNENKIKPCSRLSTIRRQAQHHAHRWRQKKRDLDL